MSSQLKQNQASQSFESESSKKRTKSSLVGKLSFGHKTSDNNTPDVQRTSGEKGSSLHQSHQSQKSNKSKMNLKINTQQNSIFRNGKKVNNQNKPAMSKYILLNTRAQLSQEKKEERQSHRDMMFEYTPKGKLKRVKFESPMLRYDLDELFDNIPELKTCFEEPIPNFAEMNQEEREKIIKKIHENLDPNKRKVTQREIDQQNNTAFRNLENEGLKKEDHYARSQWKTISKFALNSQVQNKIIPEYKKQKDYKEFKDLKQHNRPFSLYLKEDLDGLIKLTERYKEMYPVDSNRSRSKTLSSDHNKEPPQSAGRAGHYIDFSVFKSQKPGVKTVQTRQRVSKKNSKMKRGNSKRSGVQESNAQQYNEIVKLINIHQSDNRGVIKELQQDDSEEFDMSNPTDLTEDEISMKPVKLPKHFKSHIKRTHTNYQAQQMHRILTMLEVDLGQVNQYRQEYNEKSVQSKRLENSRARQKNSERFHRFQDRNCESVSNNQPDRFNKEDSNLAVSEQRFNSIDGLRENSFEHRSKMFNSKFQVDKPKFVVSTGLCNGKQYCSKHLQQMMPINYLRLLENYQKRRNSQVQPEKSNYHEDSILVYDGNRLDDQKANNEDISVDNAVLMVPSTQRQTTQGQTNLSTSNNMIADHSNQPTFRQMDDQEKEFLNNKDEFRTQDSNKTGNILAGLNIDKNGTVTKAVSFLNDDGENLFNHQRRSHQDENQVNIFKNETAENQLEELVKIEEQKMKVKLDEENTKKLQALNQEMSNEICLDIEKILLKERLFKEMVQQKNDINMFSQTDSIDNSLVQPLMSFSNDNRLKSGEHDVESSPAISTQNLVDKIQMVDEIQKDKLDTNVPQPQLPNISSYVDETKHGTLANTASIQTEVHAYENFNAANILSNTIGSIDLKENTLAEMESSPGPIRHIDSRIQNIKMGSCDILEEKNYDSSTNNPETRDYSSIRNHNDIGLLSNEDQNNKFFNNSRPQGYGTAIPGMRKRIINPLHSGYQNIFSEANDSCDRVKEQPRPVTQENINNNIRNRRMKNGSIGIIPNEKIQQEQTLNQLYSIGSPNNKTSQLSQWGIKQNKTTKNKNDMPPIKAQYPGAQQKFNYMNKRMTTAPALNGSGMRAYGNTRVRRNFMTRSKLNENKNNRANVLSLDHEIQVGSGMPNDQSKQSSFLDSFEAQRQQFCQTANPVHYRSKASNDKDYSDIKFIGQRKTLPGIQQPGKVMKIISNQSQMSNNRERLQTLPVDYLPVHENQDGILSMQERRYISLPRGAVQTKEILSPASKRSSKRPMKDYVELFALTKDAVNSEMLSQRSQSRNQSNRPRSIMNQYNFSLSIKSPEMKIKNYLNEANTVDIIDLERDSKQQLYGQEIQSRLQMETIQHFGSQEMMDNQMQTNLMSPVSSKGRSRKATRVGTNEATERMMSNSKEQPPKDKHVGWMQNQSQEREQEQMQA